MRNQKIELGIKTQVESNTQADLKQLFAASGIPEEERLETLPLFLKRQELSRLLFLNEIYHHILNIPGSIVQCGVRWGGDLVTLTSLRGIYEPYNYSRRSIGFDTFSGLAGVNEKDQGSCKVEDGQFGVTKGYAETLAKLLNLHESFSPLQHISKHTLVTGDVRDTVPKFLREHPGECIALLYLDMDIYAPTKAALAHCMSRMPNGAIIVFDEFGDRRFPGEATAYFEASCKMRLRLKRSPFSTVTVYGVMQNWGGSDSVKE